MLGAKLDVSAYLDRLNSETARLDQGAIQRWADLIYGSRRQIVYHRQRYWAVTLRTWPKTSARARCANRS
jgi:hypothetical protein